MMQVIFHSGEFSLPCVFMKGSRPFSFQTRNDVRIFQSLGLHRKRVCHPSSGEGLLFGPSGVGLL